MSYLSRLVSAKGERLLFHRIGAISQIDVFEAVTIAGTSWHIFFLDLYHSRRSRLAPEGFRLGDPKQFAGFHTYCPRFPYDFAEAKQGTPDGLRLAYIALSHVMKALDRKLFDCPMAHKAKVGIVESMMTSRMGP